MCQDAAWRLYSRYQSSQVPKVAGLLAEALTRDRLLGARSEGRQSGRYQGGTGMPLGQRVTVVDIQRVDRRGVGQCRTRGRHLATIKPKRSSLASVDGGCKVVDYARQFRTPPPDRCAYGVQQATPSLAANARGEVVPTDFVDVLYDFHSS